MKMILTKAVAAALFASAPSLVNGHGYLTKPMSRNYWQGLPSTQASGDSLSNHPRAPPVEGKMYKDNNSPALNGNTAGSCGKTQNYNSDDEYLSRDYSKWLDSTGKPMPWISRETYKKGDIIDVTIVLTAEHAGYFEMRACPLGRESGKACFDHYPLILVEDVTPHGTMPLDPIYPERAHFPNKVSKDKDLKYKFKLPDNLVGDQVLIQWQYWTANSCSPVGYADYIYETSNKPPEDFCVKPGGAGECLEDPPMFRDPNFAASNVPEIFWNCAEVTITGEPETVPDFEPDPLPPYNDSPPKEPGCLEVGKPKQDPSVVGTCGGGKEGNGICPDQNLCCSEWGNCGSGTLYCGCDVLEEIDGGGDGGDGGGTTPTPPPATTPPNGGGGGGSSGGCCSTNYKNCDSLLAAKDPPSCEGNGNKWLEDGDLEGCFASWDDCRSNMAGCCPGLVCQGDSNWASCKTGGRRTAVRAF